MASKNWMPGTRRAQLELVLTWLSVFRESAENGRGTKADEWGIPASAVSLLEEKTAGASSAIDAAVKAQTRTEVVNRECRTAFAELVAVMRDIKDRYFKKPPLKDADFVALGLKVKDTSPTKSGDPTARFAIKVNRWAPRLLGFVLECVDGDADSPANKDYHVWYKVVAHGEAPPKSPVELTKCKTTRRKKDSLDEFEYEDSGKTVYMAVQVENSGRKGPWGTMVQAIIP